MAAQQTGYAPAGPTSEQQTGQQSGQQSPAPSVGSASAVGQASELTEMLRIGSTGPAVEQAQTLLNAQGAQLAVDGVFGPLTHGATVKFQLANGLMADGIIGPQTWGALSGGGAAPPEQVPPEHGPPEQVPPELVPPEHGPPEQGPPEHGPPEQVPPGGGDVSPLQTKAAGELPMLLASPGVQASPLAPVTKSLTGEALDAKEESAPLPAVDGVQQAKALDELSRALERIVVRQEPYPGAKAPQTINEAKNMSANPAQTPAEIDWLYDFLQAVGIMGLLNEWHTRTAAGEALDSGRANIVTLALGEVGKVEARNSGGGGAQPVPGTGKQVVWRKGAADLDRIFTHAGAVVDDGHSGAGTAVRDDLYDASKEVGQGKPVPSWCGIFALSVHKYAGRTSANWAGHNAPWTGQMYGDAAYQAVNIFQEFPKPGDIAYQEKSRGPAGGQHHGIVIKVTPNDPTRPIAGFRVMTADGNFTTISSIIVHEEDKTWWDGFFRAAPKGS